MDCNKSEVCSKDDLFKIEIKEEVDTNTLITVEACFDQSQELDEDNQENLEGKIPGDENNGSYICVDCGGAFASEESLLAHNMNTCQVILKNNLHENSSDTEGCFTELYYKKFKRDNSGYSYKKNCTKPFECSECDYKCSSKGNILIHIRGVHNKEKPFKCTECDYKCSLNHTLNRHVRAVHNKEKPFKCTECDYKCNVKSSLSTHIRGVHKKEKPFKCTECVYECSMKNSLNRHISAVHRDEKPFKCSECDYRCSTKGSLYSHNKAMHKKKDTIKK